MLVPNLGESRAVVVPLVARDTDAARIAVHARSPSALGAITSGRSDFM